MHLTEVSFCGRISYLLTDNGAKAELMNLLQEQLGQPVLVPVRNVDKADDRALSTTLVNHAHLACLRSTGRRYLLFLTRVNFVNCCILIERSTPRNRALPNMILTHFRFGDTLFDNTIIDGELVQCNTNGPWVFLANDLLVHRNDSLANVNHIKRLERVHSILVNEFAPDNLDAFAIQVKAYVPHTQLRKLLEQDMPNLPYPCNAIVFKPMFKHHREVCFQLSAPSRPMTSSSECCVGNHRRLRACSPHKQADTCIHVAGSEPTHGTTHPKMFYVCKTSSPDVYELKAHDPVHGKVVAYAAVPSLTLSRALRKAVSGTNLFVKCRCSWSDRFQKWVPDVGEHCDHTTLA